ncbi:substrate-binding domain-containing protein [Brooklawnia cerclae]|uniref:ABC-type phosphate transport system substrate-binding protein n=1 Tax=Brooklawnia cerclae TaxID=349934 RepID=A0ABX0SBK6_9ACTN|nr:hypothetical protein [Brooklawnia cerclae]NIH55772.1 ABC-type phosphate transport system substrate-binding protein [Brooklawnia cerclae]
MNPIRFIRRTALAAGVGVAVAVFGFVSPASAEPVSNSYVLVGSDTLQDSLNAITNGTNLGGSFVRSTGGGNTVGNFDAFGSSLIQTKPNGPYFVRPAGSGNGRNALISSITGAAWNGKTITGQVDIARSSGGPGSNVAEDGDLLYVPYGRDAVSYAYYGTGTELASLTTAQLKQIYESDTAITINGVEVKPLIPQSGSGTRDFFLSAIGVAAADLGDIVSSTYNGVANTLPENDGSVLTTAGQIVPFSAASWIAQANGASGVNTIPTSGNVKLGSPNGVAPFTGTTTLAPASAYYSSSYGRDTYLIVEYARVNPNDSKYDAGLAALVDPSATTSLTNFGSLPSTTGAAKRKFGFLAVADTTPIRAYPNVY